jgi:methionyl-tRNA formyltransferase
LRIVFAGTPAFARIALEALLASRHRVVGVLTQPDRPAGRGLRLQASEVKQRATAAGLEVRQPRSLRRDGRFADDAAAAGDWLQQAAPDAIVVAAYGLILPRWVLDLPRLGCLNIHGSLLPRWRGAAPIQRAIEAGDACTGITIMQMDEGLDTGAMLLAESTPIGPGETAATLHDRLAGIGARLVVRALDAAQAGRLAPQAQDEALATYARKIDKAEAAIDWSTGAVQLERRALAFDPVPGLATALPGGEVLKVWGARAVADHAPPGAAPGTVLGMALDGPAPGLDVACGRGVLRLLEVQRAGGRRLPIGEHLAGHPIEPGTRLGPTTQAP